MCCESSFSFPAHTVAQILNPQFLTQIFATVITTKPNYVKGGLVQVKDLYDHVWKEFPVSIKPLLLALLESFEIVFALDDADVASLKADSSASQRNLIRSIGDSRLNLLLKARSGGRLSLSSSEGSRRLLAPSLLPEEKPALDLAWPVVDAASRTFTRRYDFAFMPNGMFSRLMIRLLTFGKAVAYWRYGCLISSKEFAADKALVELDRSINRLTISVRSPRNAEFFRVIIDLFDSLLTNWFKVTPKISALCPVCVSKQLEPTVFTKEECSLLSSQGSFFAVCNAESGNPHNVAMEQVAPDIALADFEGRRVDVDREVEILGELGRGAFGMVYKARFNQETVALKQLVTAGKEDAERQRIYEEFRREVFVMSGLHHPCIVNLKGFSLGENLAMIMEIVAGGELYKCALARSVLLFSF